MRIVRGDFATVAVSAISKVCMLRYRSRYQCGNDIGAVALHSGALGSENQLAKGADNAKDSTVLDSLYSGCLSPYDYNHSYAPHRIMSFQNEACNYDEMGIFCTLSKKSPPRGPGLRSHLRLKGTPASAYCTYPALTPRVKPSRIHCRTCLRSLIVKAPLDFRPRAQTAKPEITATVVRGSELATRPSENR